MFTVAAGFSLLPPLPGSISGSSRSLGRALQGPVCPSSRIHPMSEEDADAVSFSDEKQKSRAWLPLAWSTTGQDQNTLLGLELHPATHLLGPTSVPSLPSEAQ